MLLAIEVGNTNTLVGLFDSGKIVRTWRLSTKRPMTGDESMLLINQLLGSAEVSAQSVKGVIISCVVPELTETFVRGAKETTHAEPIVVGPHLKMDVELCYSVPEEMGADRIADVVAAWDRYRGPLIVVDFGTATTFDVVSRDGRCVGGAICPGILTGALDLARRGARLPQVEIKIPQRALSRNTLESMQSGIIYGAVGQVKELISRLTEELGDEPKVVATGGLVDVIGSELGDVEIDRDLTLKGLKILYEKNKKD